MAAAKKRRPLIFFGLLATLALLAYAFDVQSVFQWFQATFEALGLWGPLLFVGVYVVATVAMVPGLILTLIAGASFGVLWGSVWTSLASTLGATAAFLVGRYQARDWVSQKISGNDAFAAIDRAVAKDGWKIVGLTRLSPLFPFNLLNYAFGLTNVSFAHYVLASWAGMIPGTVLYVYLGSLGRAVADSAGKSPGEWVVYGVGLAATLAVTILITRNAKRALRAKL